MPSMFDSLKAKYLMWRKKQGGAVLVTPRLQNDILSLLQDVPQQTRGDETPHLQRKFLTFLAGSINAKNILELGTYEGKTAKAFAVSFPEASITTVEAIDERYEMAKDFLKDYSHVECAKADAMTYLSHARKEEKMFDFIYIDANKNYLLKHIELSRGVLSSGGIIAIDNILWGGTVGLKQDSYNYAHLMEKAIRLTQELYGKDSVTILPMYDGLLLARKK